ncbi:hypothetical protein CcaverHIS002_0506840 [Cutaneotrichosporon cavernicola]|uniref:Clathrin/coatomer adaptor adaptin-like N-terminal domain-containing protein n=1 Tax=Cutaneotrichosporon cavernicola TaxID=279322 RepID=A0AA48L6X2_9TREE|nr:uncharacterized protein CcaverHIS019_0507370 [Cutaneotrichosporon cavernicola]BEI85283.1 hypothetical protein CcaverHIS002_0506840 [Cutaneotrichosporon cavernicola]BEI93109.1 hypothetical protein CcaverHIS019_0507370 [Cutaneotrichosporon cavernicola]BEJ00886.1 hypothetical protein CcaverHIS631_0507430 [Cutaneotrichosporon cavernicola]BEJ08652.1 hypothetical protein CcaverHIS641_0507460 [Cutaneotrichosporon cavernicola]
MINRLGQRIKENFHETTRDLSLLAGGSGSGAAGYFDVSEDKVVEVSKLLESRAESERLEGMKRIIAAMSKGRNMEGFFAQVVKQVVASSIEIRKLVYIYLLRYAATNSDLLLLSINTFQKDLSDPSPLIRSMSLRVLTSMRLPVIQGIVMLGLKKLVNDRNPWVRKTVAGGLAKVYEMDTSTQSELVPLLQTLLASPSPLTLGATLTAFIEICPDRLDLLHPYYRHICRLLGDADEWGQVVALEVLTRYARAMLDKPEEVAQANGKESEDEFGGLDVDLAMLLDLSKPLLRNRNGAVVLAAAKMYYNLAPAGHASVGQEIIAAPLLRLAGTSGADATGVEISIITWDVIASMAEERPWLFASRFAHFFLHTSDKAQVMSAKMRAMVAMVSEENATAAIREFKGYTALPSDTVAEEAVRAIGHCVRSQPAVAETGLRSLMRLLKSTRSALVAQAVIVLKGVILQGVTLSSPERLVARLARQLDNITNASARASVFWLVGQFAADDGPDNTLGLKWDSVAPWVPDILRKGVKGFTEEEAPAKLQILTLVAKLLVLSPNAPKLDLFCQYLFALARWDADYDVRDRARFLAALLRGVREVDGESEDQDVGGVILRREQARVVLLGKREVALDAAAEPSELEIASMSRVAHHKLSGYTPLPEWTDDPTDASLRESEIERPKPRSPPRAFGSQPSFGSQSSAVAANLAALAAPRRSTPQTPLGSSPASSVPHTTRAKFRDLDDFLNSEGSDDESEEVTSEDEAVFEVDPVAQRRRDFVPEYDVDELEDDDETTDDSSTDESDVEAPLYRR